MRSPLSVHAFADWLEQQPPTKTYEYFHNKRCLICQYFDFIGLKYKWLDPSDWYDRKNQAHPLPAGFDDISCGRKYYTMDESEWTFGAAAKRARAAANG